MGRQRSLILSEMRRVTILSLEVPRSQLTFFNFIWQFYSHVWDRIGSERLRGERSWSVKKKDPFNCKLILTFQLDGCAEPTYTATSFIQFGLGHRPDNIRLMFLFFLTETCAHGVFIYLFIHSFSWWVSLECISKSKEISVNNRCHMGCHITITETHSRPSFAFVLLTEERLSPIHTVTILLYISSKPFSIFVFL